MIYSMQSMLITLLALGLTVCVVMLAWLVASDAREDIPEPERLHLFTSEDSDE